MSKNSPRLLAGIVVLGLFAVVGTFTVRAFTPTTAPVSAPQAATENPSDIKAPQFDPTRKGSFTQP